MPGSFTITTSGECQLRDNFAAILLNGLRDYGTAQWDGGSPECTHQQAAQPWAARPNPSGSGIGKGGAYNDAQNKAQTAYRDVCAQCGARRLDRQLGLERQPDCLGWATKNHCGECYVCHIVAVFQEVKRVLRPDGICFLNLGDSYWGGKGQSGSGGKEFQQKRVETGASFSSPAAHVGGQGKTRPTDRKHDVLKPKDMLGIPWRCAFALQADGWWLRNDIVWHKPNPLPFSGDDRFTNAHEYIFMLTKSKRYYFNAAAVAEPVKDISLQRLQRGVSDDHELLDGAPGQSPHTLHQPRSNVRLVAAKVDGYSNRAYSGKEWTPKMGGGGTGVTGHSGYKKADGTPICGPTANKRDVWSIATSGYREAHFATWPEALVKIMVLAGCPAGGTVLDLFAGSSTTLLVAEENGCKAIGIELNGDYLRLSLERLRQSVLPLTGIGEPQND